MRASGFRAATAAWLLAGTLGCLGVEAAEAQRRETTDEAGLLRQSAALESQGDLEGAAAALRTLLELDPGSSGGLFALERVLRGQGRTVEILPHVHAFLTQEPESSGVRYLELRVLEGVDSLDAVEREAEAWLALEPESELPYREIARVYERAFGPRRALDLLARGRSATGRDDALALEMGDLHAALGDTMAAVQEWGRAVGDDGAQATAVARRVAGLGPGADAAGERVVDALSGSGMRARREAGVRIALDLRLEQSALDLARDVSRDLDDRARRSFLGDVARRARDAELVAVASWAYAELGEAAQSAAERRQFDQRVVDVALAAGDTAAALEAQRRVADSFTQGSVDRRRAVAQVIRLESGQADPERLGELLGDFREEFPNAPELDDLAATVAAGLQARGDVRGAAAMLDGIEGPQSSLERAYLLLDAGDVEEGRRALLFSISGLAPAEATEVIQLAALLGRLSPEGAGLLARAAVRAHAGAGQHGARLVYDSLGSVPEEERAPILAEGARMADRAGFETVGALLRTRILNDHADTSEFEEASLGLARHLARRPDTVERAITTLEELIGARPNAAVVPDARLELERLRARRR